MKLNAFLIPCFALGLVTATPLPSTEDLSNATGPTTSLSKRTTTEWSSAPHLLSKRGGGGEGEAEVESESAPKKAKDPDLKWNTAPGDIKFLPGGPEAAEKRICDYARHKGCLKGTVTAIEEPGMDSRVDITDLVMAPGADSARILRLNEDGSYGRVPGSNAASSASSSEPDSHGGHQHWQWWRKQGRKLKKQGQKLDQYLFGHY